MSNGKEAQLTLASIKTAATEKQWMSQVIELAKLTGWATYHPFLSIHSERGFPDLTLVRERLIFVELKAEKGKLSSDQTKWIERLKAAKQEVYCWKPSQWDEAVMVLSKRQSFESVIDDYEENFE